MEIIITSDIVFKAITVLLTFVSIVLTWFSFKRANTNIYQKERYEKVIFPVFNILEPYLYQKEVTKNEPAMFAIKLSKEIINTNKMIAGGKLKYIFSQSVNDDNFFTMSEFINKEYDRCCIDLGLALRPIEYKATCFRNRNIRILILLCIKYLLPLIIIFVSVISFIFLNLLR